MADAVVQFAREQLAGARAGVRPLSLGVGTFNLRQQLAIQDELEQRRRDEPDIEPFFDRSRDEPFFVKNLENIQGDERDVIFLSVTYAKGRDGRLRHNFGPLNGENGWRRLNVLTTRARRAMRVFSSMRGQRHPRGPVEGRAAAARAFSSTPSPAASTIPSIVAAARTESPFEREVVTDLTRRGHLVQPQVGVAGYRIDIGVRDPDAPGRFLLGIECDGVAYHASETARDRDRLRQQVLEARGWTIVRLWCTDWFKDRAGQMERLEQAIADARATRARDSRQADRRGREPAGPPARRSPGGAGPVRRRCSELPSARAVVALSGLTRRIDRVAAGRVRHLRKAPAQVVERALPYEKAPQPSLPADDVLECDARTLGVDRRARRRRRIAGARG